MEYIVGHYALNVRRACRLIKQTRSVQYYRSVKDPRHDLRSRMREIARTRVRYGYRRIHVLLKRDGWQLGRNQMYRLYREEQLQLRSKLPKRRKMVGLGLTWLSMMQHQRNTPAIRALKTPKTNRQNGPRNPSGSEPGNRD